MNTQTTRTREQIEPARWDQLKSILDEALQEPETTRAALLKERCAEDAQLLREAESLLAEADTLLNDPTDWLEGGAEQATRTFWDDKEVSRVGQRIGAYVVVRPLGRGGMGAVYLAARADGQFEKEVAIKVLKRGTDTDDVLQRFSKERQIVARLDHPNIARLLDAGTTDDGLPYFVMEFVDGVPVTQHVRTHQLSLGQQLELFLKICAAVEVAHRAAVIHRDLKPRNILVNADGEPKLLDFGIAKLLEADAEATITGREHLTPSAASPEQARGDDVTAASDVYALGALLYEMLTSQGPHRFSSPHPGREEVLRVVCEKEPTPPSKAVATREKARQLQGDLDHIVLHALRKDPARRYSSAAHFAEDVRRHLSGESVQARRLRHQLLTPRALAVAAVLLLLAGGIASLFLLGGGRHPLLSSESAAAAQPGKSIAVLPFENLSEEGENAFFAIGVQDAILTDLAKVADLKVLSRGSVEQYSNPKTRDIREISRALNVAHVIEGGVQRVANRVRVTARLVDGRTGEQKWAENYDRELADAFTIQSQIAQTIVARLQAKLLPREKAAIEVPPTRDPVAYDLYVRARDMVDSYLNAPDAKASLEQAIGLLMEATQRDPHFAVAWSYAARAHSIIFALGLDPDAVHPSQAEAALERAFGLDPELPEAHFAKAENLYRVDGRYELAEREIALALPGMPNSAPLHTLAGNVWRRQARWHEAEQSLIRAVELDPKNANAISFLADTQILMRRYTEAIATYERARAMGFDPVLFAVRVGVIDFLATGRSEPLRGALARAPADLDIDGGDTQWRILFALMDRDYDRAAAALARSPRSTFQDVDLSFYYPRSWYEGVIARAAGRSGEARAAFRRVLADLGADEEDGRFRFRTLAVIAQARAAVGETEHAIECAERAAHLIGVNYNAYDGPLIQQGLAQVYTWTGQHDRALEIIERLVKSPGYLSYGHLLHDPAWEPLRSKPRFQALTASLAPGAAAVAASPAREEVMVEKSIAVLPFQNLSSAPENAYFAAGVQDAILTDLAKIADLKVINRTSVQHYSADAPRNLREISEQLRVAYVLEGSVQRVGDRMRVTAKLIETRTNTQRWAERYDRDLSDVFAIQNEIAKAIALQLRAWLSPTEQAAVQKSPTRDLAAYELFLRAQVSDRGVTREAADVAEQVKLLDEAVARDPQFVPAWCLLARAHLRSYFLNIDHSEARPPGRKALAAAAAIAPHSGEVQLAEAALLYWGERRYEGALEKLAEARRSLPNDSTVPLFTGLIMRRQGEWEESTRHFREAVSLDPRNANTLSELANSLKALRRYEEEAEILDGLLSWNPGNYFFEHARGMVDINRSADPRRLQKVLAAEWPNAGNQEHLVLTRLWLALLLRDYAAADKILSTYPKADFRAAGYVVPRESYAAIIAQGLGDEKRARAVFMKAREAAVRIADAQPKDGKALIVLASIDARLGQDDAARRQAEHAVRLLPVSLDAAAGVDVMVDLAEIYARIGEKRRALDILEEAAKLPWALNYGFLKLDETWDPLRAEPRFAKLLSAFAPE